jgi:hypothetical protein
MQQQRQLGLVVGSLGAGTAGIRHHRRGTPAPLALMSVAFIGLVFSVVVEYRQMALSITARVSAPRQVELGSMWLVSGPCLLVGLVLQLGLQLHLALVLARCRQGHMHLRCLLVVWLLVFGQLRPGLLLLCMRPASMMLLFWLLSLLFPQVISRRGLSLLCLCQLEQRRLSLVCLLCICIATWLISPLLLLLALPLVARWVCLHLALLLLCLSV